MRLNKRKSTGLLSKTWNAIRPELKQRIVAWALVLSMSGTALCGSVFLLKNWLYKSSFFQITEIKINGCKVVSKAMALKLSGVDIYSNLLALDSKEVKRNIENDVWIDSAILKRHWPSKLEITIKERKPVALLNTSQGLYYLDRHAVAFAKASTVADRDFPMITGVDGVVIGKESGQKTKEQKYIKDALRFIDCAARGSTSLPGQNISDFTVTKDNKLVMFLVDSPFPIYLGDEVTKKQYFRLAKVLSKLYKKREFKAVEYIQMDYAPDQVLVRKETT